MIEVSKCGKIQCVGSSQAEYTGSRLISEVKQPRAELVPGRETAWEPSVSYTFALSDSCLVQFLQRRNAGMEYGLDAAQVKFLRKRAKDGYIRTIIISLIRGFIIAPVFLLDPLLTAGSTTIFWTLVSIVWSFYSSGICYMIMYIFDLVTGHFSVCFESVNKKITDLMFTKNAKFETRQILLK